MKNVAMAVVRDVKGANGVVVPVLNNVMSAVKIVEKVNAEMAAKAVTGVNVVKAVKIAKNVVVDGR